MSNFNLTEWALRHKQLVYFFVVLTFAAGIFSYQQLGRMEDPEFVLRVMIVSVAWPGASAKQMTEQVADKIERKLQDTPSLDNVKSYSQPGQTVIYVTLKESLSEQEVRPIWLEVRNMVNDMKGTLPQGVVGPYFNDRFDDVFGNIYALTADGFTYEEMREKAEQIRRVFLGVKSVKKVDLLGVQPEKIYIEMESSKLAQMGLDPNVIVAAVKAQSAMNPAGMVETDSDAVHLRLTGLFSDMTALRELPIRANDRTFRLGDVAVIHRAYGEPMEPRMYYNGQPAIGIAVSMEKGGNILALGDHLESALAQIRRDLPLGLDISQVCNQPQVVKKSIGDFTASLFEAIVIVLAVNFLSLGYRSGIVVALCIPLVLAGVFTGMHIFGIPLHKVSLGALIIALGLLVDDAIIAVEMMAVKLEEGWGRFEAACYAYKATAIPMLTGTLITCAGFIPVGFAKGDAAHFTGSLFTVITLALVLSWFVSVLVTPLFGYSLVRTRGTAVGHARYDTKFYLLFRRTLAWCLSHRALVLALTAFCFLGSIGLLKFVRQEFFPPSIRPEIIVQMNLPEGSSLAASDETARRFAAALDGNESIESYSYYVGIGAPRFVLTREPKLKAANFIEFVLVAKNLAGRDSLVATVENLLDSRFAEVRGTVKLIETGPSSPYPVMMRVAGSDAGKVREIANQVSRIMEDNPHLRNINFDWNEKSKIMRLEVDQDKARLLGVNNQGLALDLQAQLSGAAIAEYYEGDRTVAIVYRLDGGSRQDLAAVKDLPVHVGGGRFVPLAQIARISYDAEEGLLWRRDLKPTITVRADIRPGITGNDAAQQVYNSLQPLIRSLPAGYSVSIDGSLDRSKSSMSFLLQPVPAMIAVIVILLMIQLQNVSLTLLTLLTAPLGIIGVSLSLLLTMLPMGFVAQMGILALSGMIIRNSVILIDQIGRHMAAGQTPYDAIIDSAVLRFRPIMLTAAAAILGMVPLIPSNFFGPMAVAIAGGLLGATLLTLIVLPVMYAAWYRVTPGPSATADGQEPATIGPA